MEFIQNMSFCFINMCYMLKNSSKYQTHR